MKDQQMHQSEKAAPRAKAITVIIGLLGLFVIAAAFVVYAHQFNGPLTHNHSRWAEFGDFVGGVSGPLLAFLGLLALLTTILLQLEELRDTREQLRNSAESLRTQSRIMQTQLLDSAFFSMLRLHNDIVSTMDTKGPAGQPLSGRDCLAEFGNSFRMQYRKLQDRSENKPAIDEVVERYEHVFNLHQSDLGHYFRILYNIVRFIDERCGDLDRQYIRLVRAQLSNEELVLLFYNGLTSTGTKFKQLIEKYAMLDNLKDGELLDPSHKGEYAESAFDSDLAWAQANKRIQAAG